MFWYRCVLLLKSHTWAVLSLLMFSSRLDGQITKGCFYCRIRLCCYCKAHLSVLFSPFSVCLYITYRRQPLMQQDSDHRRTPSVTFSTIELSVVRPSSCKVTTQPTETCLLCMKKVFCLSVWKRLHFRCTFYWILVESPVKFCSVGRVHFSYVT